MRLTKKRADNGKYYLSGLAEVSNSYSKGYGRIQVGHAVEKLAEYEDLEEQGNLLKLDFKYQKIMIGQDIFVVEDGTVKPKKICRINEWWNDYHGFQGEYAATPSDGFGSWEFKYEDFGKTVFLTKEEAEAAWKGGNYR